MQTQNLPFSGVQIPPEPPPPLCKLALPHRTATGRWRLLLHSVTVNAPGTGPLFGAGRCALASGHTEAALRGWCRNPAQR